MQPRRSFIAVGTLAGLLALPVASAGAATDTTSRGTATTTTVPLHVEAANLPMDLGRTVLTATTNGDMTQKAPWSAVALTLADIAGTRIGELSVASDDSTSSQGSSMERDMAIGAIAATAGDLVANADKAAGSATAAVSALTTEATVLNALGLSATITDVIAAVDDEAATTTHTLAVAGIDLDLANVLGEVLGTLPLQDLIAIADELGVEIPVDLSSAGAVVTATQDLLTAIADAGARADEVEDAADALLSADGGTLTALQALLAQAEALDPTTDLTDDLGGILDSADELTGTLGDAVDDTVGTIDDPIGTIDDTIGTVGGTVDTAGDTVGGTVDDVTGVLTVAALATDCASLKLLGTVEDLEAVITCLEGEITAHLNRLADEYEALSTAVDEYVAAVRAATDAAAILESDSSSLGDIVGQIQGLLDDLLGADLAAIGPIEVTQQTRAVGGQLDASSASHTCNVTTLTVLGGTPIDVADCDGGTAQTGIDTVTTTLGSILGAVGGVDVGDGISLELFGTVEDNVTEDADGVVRATSVLEVLRLTIPDVTIAPCDVATVGQLACALGLDLDGPLTDALDGIDGALTTAHSTVTTALDTVASLTALLESELNLAPLPNVTVTAISNAQALVDTAVPALRDAIDSLTDGLGELGTGGGITVPGATIVVDPTLETEHQVVTAAADPISPAPGTSDPAAGPTPTLPNTGGGAALLAVLTLGAGTWLFRRREVQ